VEDLVCSPAIIVKQSPDATNVAHTVYTCFLDSHLEPEEKQSPPQDQEGEETSAKSGTVQIHLYSHCLFLCCEYTAG
jgi:hypothetical protein